MTTAEEAATIAKSIKANATNLGLTWNLRLGTVKTVGPAATVTLDGDDVSVPPIPAISLIGAVIPGARVMTLWVPPTTLFLVGSPSGTVSRTMTNRILTTCSADRTLTAVDQTLTSTLTTVRVDGLANWEVAAAFDFHQTAFSTPVTFVGSLYVDGVAQAATAIFQVTGVQRVTAFQQWTGTFTAGGGHSFGLQAKVQAVSGTSLARLTNSNMLVKTYE